LGWPIGRADCAAGPRPLVVFADPSVVVADKPAGVASQSKREGERGTLPALVEEALRTQDPRSRRAPLYIVHRLDQAASGLVVLARTRAAAATLSSAFREHAVSRRYAALVVPAPPDDEFVIDAPILEVGRGARCDPRGKPARTFVRVVRRIEAGALVEATLDTGRLHQLRVHLASVSCPIAGDRRYAGVPFARLALHAIHLAFEHPRTGKSLAFDSPVPRDFAP
jgi:RluA family pseudouridine synthase